MEYFALCECDHWLGELGAYMTERTLKSEQRADETRTRQMVSGTSGQLRETNC